MARIKFTRENPPDEHDQFFLKACEFVFETLQDADKDLMRLNISLDAHSVARLQSHADRLGIPRASLASAAVYRFLEYLDYVEREYTILRSLKDGNS